MRPFQVFIKRQDKVPLKTWRDSDSKAKLYLIKISHMSNMIWMCYIWSTHLTDYLADIITSIIPQIMNSIHKYKTISYFYVTLLHVWPAWSNLILLKVTEALNAEITHWNMTYCIIILTETHAYWLKYPNLTKVQKKKTEKSLNWFLSHFT